MVQHVQVLCEDGRESIQGIRWFVGLRFMPFTIVSTLNCLHFASDAGDPDFRAESDELRILLPKGLEIIGAAVAGTDALKAVKKAGEFSYKLISHMCPHLDKPEGVITACLEPGSAISQYYYCTGVKYSTAEACDGVIGHEKPDHYLWSNMCLLQCKLQLNIPVYADSFPKPSDVGTQLSTAVKKILHDLRSSDSFSYIEGYARNSGKKLHLLLSSSLENQQTRDLCVGTDGLKEPEMLCCLDISPPGSFSSAYGVQMPSPLNFTLLCSQSMATGKVSAPFIEYLPASGRTSIKTLSFNLDVLCLAHNELSLRKSTTTLVLPAIIDQLEAAKNVVLKEETENVKLCAYHFCPPGFLHPISCLYNMSYGESEIQIMEYRRMLHLRLALPMDRPLLRVANALPFHKVKDEAFGGSQGSNAGRSRLSNVHVELPRSGVLGGHASTLACSYEYYHYLQDNMDDTGWGCAYRSLQTIVSWFRLQHYTTIDVPTHRTIQEVLVEIGDKERSFIGSQEWIGAIELSFVLDKLLGVTSKILNVRSGAELPEKCRELSLHFETQGTPVMIGGGVLAYTLLGVDYNEATGESAFLILDPHYTGAEDLKTILAGGWCGWKKAVTSEGKEFFLRNKFYNLLLPQRPNTI